MCEWFSVRVRRCISCACLMSTMHVLRRAGCMLSGEVRDSDDDDGKGNDGDDEMTVIVIPMTRRGW